MSKSTGNQQFPTEVQIGTETYKVEDHPGLKQFFEQTVTIASQREKDKLYPSITAKDNQIATLTGQLAQANTDSQTAAAGWQQSQRENTTLKNQLAAANASSPAAGLTGDDVRKILQDEFISKIPGATAEVIQPLQAELAKQAAQRIEDFKKKRIAEEGEAIIPELVNGNTEAEIETSILFAREMKAKYGATQQPGSQQQQQPGQQQQQNQPASSGTNNNGNMQQNNQQGNQQQQQPVTPPASTPTTVTPDIENMPDVKNMSPEEYANQRGDLLKKLQGITYNGNTQQ